jgi:hypothetical protein
MIGILFGSNPLVLLLFLSATPLNPQKRKAAAAG